MSNFSIENEDLCKVLGKMLGEKIAHSSYSVTELQGGGVGDVYLVEGTAEAASGEGFPYKVVLKIQNKWLRPGDPDSWRREYDLYISDLGAVLPDHFRWPKCYHAEIKGDEIQIWMEYIEGISGLELTTEMLEEAAYEMGRFQGRLYNRPELLQNLTNFGDTGFLKRHYQQWHNQEYSYDQLIAEDCPIPDSLKQALKDSKIVMCGKSFEHSYLRSDVCIIPAHLKQMIFDIDDNMDTLFDEIAKLPIVLCHRDYWNENIIYDNGVFCLIDWDTSGWGYLGEDLSTLISDDIDYTKFEEFCERLIPAYYRGISEFMDISGIRKKYIREMILINFGYRMVQAHMFADNDEERAEQVQKLEKIYNM